MTVDPSSCLGRWNHRVKRAKWVGVPASHNLAVIAHHSRKSRKKICGQVVSPSPVCYGAPCHRRPLKWLTVAESEPVAPEIVKQLPTFGGRVWAGRVSVPKRKRFPQTPSKVFNPGLQSSVFKTLISW